MKSATLQSQDPDNYKKTWGFFKSLKPDQPRVTVTALPCQLRILYRLGVSSGFLSKLQVSEDLEPGLSVSAHRIASVVFQQHAVTL